MGLEEEVGGSGADDCVGGTASQGLDEPLSLFRSLNEVQTK